jgi:hypothetical protein
MRLVKHLLLELLVVGQGKLAECGDSDQVAVFLNSNHGLIPRK